MQLISCSIYKIILNSKNILKNYGKLTKITCNNLKETKRGGDFDNTAVKRSNELVAEITQTNAFNTHL